MAVERRAGRYGDALLLEFGCEFSRAAVLASLLVGMKKQTRVPFGWLNAPRPHVVEPVLNAVRPPRVPPSGHEVAIAVWRGRVVVRQELLKQSLGAGGTVRAAPGSN